MKGKRHLKPGEGSVIGHGERSGGERHLGEWGLKISMVMVLTETHDQHRQGYSYGSGWGGEPQERVERKEWELLSIDSGSKERKG